MKRIATQFKLELPPEWSLQEELGTTQEELEISWDWLSLLTYFINVTFAKLTNSEIQRNLKRLVNIISSSQAILIHIDSETSTYYSTAAVEVFSNLGIVQLSKPLQEKIAEDQRNYISFHPNDAAINDSIFQNFAADHIIEIFTIWHNDNSSDLLPLIQPINSRSYRNQACPIRRSAISDGLKKYSLNSNTLPNPV